jgi:hypothetical protein
MRKKTERNNGKQSVLLRALQWASLRALQQASLRASQQVSTILDEETKLKYETAMRAYSGGLHDRILNTTLDEETKSKS